ncbi:MAG: amino acid ABC transporter substrate-binding protein [Cyanobacteria bacterium J06642_2]
MRSNKWISGMGAIAFLAVAGCSSAPSVEEGVEAVSSAVSPGVLSQVKSRGKVNCAVNKELPGFGSLDESGEFTGFDIDICRAVSAAVFGDPDQVEFKVVTSANRQTAIQSGEVDMISRNTTWTLTRDREWGATYGPTVYYDGQGFIVPKDTGITTIEELDGATICVIAGTTTELNLADTFRSRGLEFTPVVFDGDDATFNAFEEGRCDANTGDQSALISRRTQLAEPDSYLILEEVISKEPLGPLVKSGDAEWADVLFWTVSALFYADEKGITSENIDSFMDSDDPNIKRFVGTEGNMGELLGLEPDFAVNVIKSVGNYSELFDRNLTPLGVSRGLNQSYTTGGILYAPPFR